MVSQPLSQRYIRRKKRTNLEILVQLGNTELSYLTKREGRGRESHELTCPEEKKIPLSTSIPGTDDTKK